MEKINTVARVCVVQDRKLLLVSNSGSYWYLPGGHMELRENLVECAMREVYEETGYKVVVEDVVYVSEFYDKKIGSHKVECIFRAKIKSDSGTSEWIDLGIDKSVTMKEWFGLDEIKNMDNVKPDFLKDGGWLLEVKGKIYMGYEESQ